MEALAFGLVAALLWGLHDFSARVIGGRVETLPLMAGVLATGIVLLLPLALGGDWSRLGPVEVALCLGAGLAYVCAGYGLYRAFSIGPVYLAASVCGSYPLLSVAFAVMRGEAPPPVAWLCVAVVVAGIALVARSADHGPPSAHGSRRAAIGWAAVSSFGFAATFALSQWASESGAPLQVSLVVRVATLVLVLMLIGWVRPPVRGTLRTWRMVVLMGALDVGALTLVTLAGGLPRAEYASVAASIFGVITILLAWRILNERLGAVQWLGCALVFAGIAALGLAGHGGHG